SGGRRVKNVVLAPNRGSTCRKKTSMISRAGLPSRSAAKNSPNTTCSIPASKTLTSYVAMSSMVSPNTILKDRYFQGSILVDDRDFQIARLRGARYKDQKEKKILENLFPQFTTWSGLMANSGFRPFRLPTIRCISTPAKPGLNRF